MPTTPNTHAGSHVHLVRLIIAVATILGEALPASQPPNNYAPLDVSTLLAGKSGSNIVISCSDGASPYQFISNSKPTFDDAPSFTTAVGATCSSTYLNALSQPGNVFYLIVDNAAGPSAPIISTAYGQPGDTVTIRGTNLDGATLIGPDGQTIPVTTNTRDTITFTVPSSGMAGGYLQIYNTRSYLTQSVSQQGELLPTATNPGATKSPFFMPYNFTPTVNNDLFQVAFYQDSTNTTRKMMVSGREGATNPRIYIQNPDTRSWAPLTTSFRNPMGMSLGVLSDGKPYLFYSSGLPVSTATVNSVVKLDFLAATPTVSAFRQLTSDMTGDPVNVRATSYVAGDATHENSVFSFNPLTATDDIRQAQEVTTAVKPVWITFPWGSDTGTKNFPGGLGVKRRDATVNPLYFYVTNGLAVSGTPTVSRIEFWSTAASGNPPAHTKIWTSELWPSPLTLSDHPIVNAGQVALEPFGSQHAYVADRGNVAVDAQAVSKIHKLNSDYCFSAASCTMFVSSFSYGNRLLSARGVAIETGTNAFNNPYSKWLWVAQQLPSGGPITGGGVSKVRALREIPIQVILTTNAGWTLGTNEYHGNGISVMWAGDKHYMNIDPVTLAQFVVDSVARANQILYNVGYQINFDPTRDFKVVDDSSITTTLPHTYRSSLSGTCSPELSSLLTLAAPDPKRIPIILVHAIGKAEVDPIQYAKVNGITDYFPTPCGGTSWAILVNPMSSGVNDSPSTNLCQQSPYDTTDCWAPTSTNTFSHELFHRLTWRLGSTILGAFGFDSSGHKLNPCPSDLMCGQGQYPAMPGFRTSSLLSSDRDDDLANTDSDGVNDNPGSTLILPDHGAP